MQERHTAAIVVIIAAAALPGCLFKADGTEGGTADSGPLPPFGSDELIPCQDLPYVPDGTYFVDDVAMEGDEMVINVNYGGGCADHEWMLCYPGWHWLADFGPYPLLLLHEDNNDTCEANPHEILRFDISKILEWNPGYIDDPLTLCLLDIEECGDLASTWCGSYDLNEDDHCVSYEYAE